jgi:hypothetical protein
MSEVMTAQKRALRSGHDAVGESMNILKQPLNLPPMGDDPVSGSNYRLRYSRVTTFT